MNFYNGNINQTVVRLSFFLFSSLKKIQTANASQTKTYRGKTCSPVSMQFSKRKKNISQTEQISSDNWKRQKESQFRVTNYIKTHSFNVHCLQ